MTRPPALRPVAPRDLVAVAPQALRPEDYLEGALVEGEGIPPELGGLGLHESVVRQLDLPDARFRGARFTEVVWDHVRAASLHLASATLQDVRFLECRIGSAEAYDAAWRRVEIVGGKVDFVNLRGAHLTDVLVRDCVVGDLDLGQARVERLAFQDCHVGALDVTSARLKDADLRGAQLRSIRGYEGLAGATVTSAQLLDLTPALAEHLGLRVV